MRDLIREEDLAATLTRVPDWRLEGRKIVRTFTHPNFATALAFVNRVGTLAEEFNHHPDIIIRWNKVTLRLCTHSSGGITALDLDLAARIDTTSTS